MRYSPAMRTNAIQLLTALSVLEAAIILPSAAAAQNAPAKTVGGSHEEILVQSTHRWLRTISIPAFEGLPRLGIQAPRQTSSKAEVVAEEALRQGELVSYWQLLAFNLYSRWDSAGRPGTRRAITPELMQNVNKRTVVAVGNEEGIRALVCKPTGFCAWSSPGALPRATHLTQYAIEWGDGEPGVEKRFNSELLPGLKAMARIAPPIAHYVSEVISGPFDRSAGGVPFDPTALMRNVAPMPGASRYPSKAGDFIRENCQTPGQRCPVLKMAPADAQAWSRGGLVTLYVVSRIKIDDFVDSSGGRWQLQYRLDDPLYRVYRDPQLSHLLGEFKYPMSSDGSVDWNLIGPNVAVSATISLPASDEQRAPTQPKSARNFSGAWSVMDGQLTILHSGNGLVVIDSTFGGRYGKALRSLLECSDRSSDCIRKAGGVTSTGPLKQQWIGDTLIIGAEERPYGFRMFLSPDGSQLFTNLQASMVRAYDRKRPD